MPALIMDESSTAGSLDLKKDRSHAQEEATHVRSPPAQTQAIAQANGVPSQHANGALPNGVLATSLPLPRTNGENSQVETALSGPVNPPPLDQSWREGQTNKSLGLLMQGTAQQCYFDLNETLTAMNEIAVEPQQHEVNGIAHHTAQQDTSEGSLQKKRLLMDFANNQRDRFIKALVLSDWCKREEEQGRLIDVKSWQEKQRNAHESATRAVGNTKINMNPAKVPNPNIEGAMELLATGKASWVPDLGYIPPKRLSAKQLLKTLRNMNVILATRLNLHEDLPQHFQTFSIADGRTTFTVKDEFEVDLSVADEDPATPFYFIDIRLLFQPTSNVLDEHMRSFMEGRANHELASKGLKGCYEFLHNFVLTHKINILRSQAAELTRGKWFDCIKPESRRRSFFVQYWASMSGTKSWIEIGISSGRQKISRTGQIVNPHTSIRWFRRGVEVKDQILEFDWRDLDLERCLTTVIVKHTAWQLNELQSQIQSLATPSTETKLTCDTEESALYLSLPSVPERLRIGVEPITGQYTISPPSGPTARTEHRLNNDPSANAAKLLASLPCTVVQQRVRREAELLAWTPAALVVTQDNITGVFGDGVRQFSAYVPGPAWGNEWALACTFGLRGEHWWIVRVEAKRDDQNAVTAKIIASARRISPPGSTAIENSVSSPSLLRIEKLAVAEVAFAALSKQLKDLHIQHKFEPMVMQASGGQLHSLEVSPPVAMIIRFSQLMKEPRNKSWAAEVVRLTHHGVVDVGGLAEGDTGSTRHDLRLSLESGKMKNLQQHLTQLRDRDLAMNSTGGLALQFATPFGQPFAEQIRRRLQSVERLDRYVALLKERRFRCTHISLSRLAFTYHKSPALNARITFSNDGGLPGRLKLEPSDSNPHQRIRVMLEQNLNSAESDGFNTFTSILRFTLPLLQTLERLETIDPVRRTLSVHARTSTWFDLRYSAPFPACVFRLKAKMRTEGKKKIVKWFLEGLPDVTTNAGRLEDFVQALKDFWQSQGDHWEGLGNCIVADAQSIGAALERLDAVVRRFDGHVETPSNPPESGQQPTTQQPQNAVQKATQGRPQNQPQKPINGRPAAVKKPEPDVIMLD